MSLCAMCMKEPIAVKYCRLGKRCYNREWRKSQGPGSKYRVRAALSSIKRTGFGRQELGGEVRLLSSEQSVVIPIRKRVRA